MSIPSSITRSHLLQAIAEVERDGVPDRRRSRDYDLVYDGVTYPPKYVVSVAARLATGTMLDSEAFGGGTETNEFLASRGFTVVLKGRPIASARAAPAMPLSGTRVAVVAMRPGSRGDENRALVDVFDRTRASHTGALLVLFPGVEKWSLDADRVVSVAEEHGAHMLFETHDDRGRGVYRAFDPNRGVLEREVYQLVADSGARPEAIQRLLDAVDGGHRTYALAGLSVGLLVCGENNVLVNQQAYGNRCAGVRGHPHRGLFVGVDIILNGAHSLMGNWSKLNARFEWLSAGRTVAYTTNNTGKSWGRALRVYHDGRRVADGTGVHAGWDAPLRASHVRDRADRFAAVVLDLER